MTHRIEHSTPPMFSGSMLLMRSSCFASGKLLEEGATYAVPQEVSAEDAEELVRIGRAQPTNTPA